MRQRKKVIKDAGWYIFEKHTNPKSHRTSYIVQFRSWDSAVRINIEEINRIFNPSWIKGKSTTHTFRFKNRKNAEQLLLMAQLKLQYSG